MNDDDVKNLIAAVRAMAALVGRGIVEGAYTNTVGGDQYAERVLKSADELLLHVSPKP